MRTFTGLGFDPAPGSVADVEAVLARLARGVTAVDGSAASLRRAARPGGWRGPAASAFRAGTGTLAGGLDEVVDAVRSAERAVSAWQSRLVANQREAELLDALARPLRAAAARPGAGPEVRAELDRVLGRAQRLAARHLRQAAEAARAVRSVRSVAGIGFPAGWPAGSADVAAQLSGRVTWWTGDLAVGLAVPVWPPDPAAPALPGVPGVPLGEEGGSGTPGTAGPGVPDLPSGPGAPGLPTLPDLSGVPGLPGGPDVPGLPAPAGWPLVDGLPVLPYDPGTTTSAGLLDTGSAPVLRPEHLAGHRAPDLPGANALASTAGHADVSARPSVRADVTEPVRRGPVERVLDQTTRGDRGVPPAGRGETVARETHGRAEPDRGGAPARNLSAPHTEPDRHTPARHDPVVTGTGTAALPMAQQAGPVEPAAPAAPPAPAQAAPGPAPEPVPIDRTVEQHAAPPPAEQRPLEQRAAAPSADRPLPDQSGDRSAPRGQLLEPGRFSAADPSPRPPSAGTPAGGPATAAQAQPSAVKGRGEDDVLAAAFVPVPGEQVQQPGAGAGGLRAFLLTRPESRPVLVLIKPGSGAEPLFLTGLTPCASPLPGCAAPVPPNGPTTVY